MDGRTRIEWRCPAPRCAWFLAIKIFLLPLSILKATDQVVTDPGDNGGANQLRAKITAAQNSGGGTITFTTGPANIVLANGVLPPITSNVSLEGGNIITLNGNNATFLFQVNAGGTLTLNHLTITGGLNASGDGGAIRNGSSPGNGGTLNINNCTFVSNEAAASFSGGAIVSYGPLNIANSEFDSNKAGNGGAVYPRFPPAITNITGCNFHDNATTNATDGWGGAMLLWDGAPVNVENTTFANNNARSGGAAYVFSNASLTTNAVTLQGNNAVLAGGAIYVAGAATLQLHSTQLHANAATATSGPVSMSFGGGAIANFGNTSIDGCTVSANTVAFYNGGGILTVAGSLTITASLLEGNSAPSGGGIEVDGQTTVSVSASTIRDNSTSLGGSGGGINNEFFTATMTLNGCTINNNVAGAGGGIFNGNFLTITNCTLTANHAQTNGGGLYNGSNDGVPSITLLNSTISGNSSASSGGGGIYLEGGFFSGDVTLKNTILANNITGGNLVRGATGGGNINSNGFNLCDDSSGAAFLTNTGDKVGASFDAKLGPLAVNGGPTQTELPQAGSAAIDSATASGAPARDQRNYLRNGAPDIGAAEVGGTLPTSLGNISTRALVQTGNNVMIGGLIVTGGGPKKVILRALGPTLGQPPFNIPNVLTNPVLELRNSGGALIASNDNWMSASNAAAITSSGFAPPDSVESAILTNLNPGNYTAIVRGTNNATGVALVEGYDLDNTAGSKFGNISTRAFVGTGGNVMAGRFGPAWGVQ